MKLDFSLIVSFVIAGVVLAIVSPMVTKAIGGNEFESHDN